MRIAVGATLAPDGGLSVAAPFPVVLLVCGEGENPSGEGFGAASDRVIAADEDDLLARARTERIGHKGEAVGVERLRILVGMADRADPVALIGSKSSPREGADEGAGVRCCHFPLDQL